ncbi:MAG: response regulator, partial [Burkholderiaceae bacterium]
EAAQVAAEEAAKEVAAPAPAAPLLELVPPPSAEANDAEPSEDSIKVIGPLRISITLFNIFLNEADELSRRLSTSLAEWALELARPVPANAEALSHALAGNAATVGFEDLSALARALEHALGRAQRASRYSEEEAQLFIRAADDIRHLLHQFAAGFLKAHDPALLERLHAYEPVEDLSQAGGLDSESGTDALLAELQMPSADADEVEPGLPDQIEPVLFPIFEEEAHELLQQLHAALREWLLKPAERTSAAACMRVLHTFKGGARLCGAMRLGEQAHDMESAIEAALRDGPPQAGDLLALQELGDSLESGFEQLSARLKAEALAPAPLPETAPAAETQETQEAPETHEAPAAQGALEAAEAEGAEGAAVVAEDADAAAEALAATAAARPAAQHRLRADAGVDWSRFVETEREEATAGDALNAAAQAMVRVRGSLLERMAAQAGEVSIRRARLESELAQMKGALLDLDDNLDRLRGQLRELEVQAEAQMGAQQELAKQAQQGVAEFDPLEFDRYTRFQELTRMLAESVNDVATVQRSLQRNVQLGEDELAAQSRLTRELQDDLLRTRMVEFDSLGERLHRVVRQAARDAGRQARLEIVGGGTELDRSVLERMAGAFEHLLRNSVSHGIEAPEQRQAAGKDVVGTLRVQARQEGNEFLLDFADDGAGLDLPRIRERGLALGLIKPDESPDDAALMQLIFAPGFSTATQVTELSGRGVGMDVVRADVSTLGGSIETASVRGRGASFTLRLPLTTALTQIVLLRCGEQTVAVPASLMDGVQRLPLEQVEAAYAEGSIELGGAGNGQRQPFYWLGGLLGQAGHGHAHGKTVSVVLVRSAQQRLVLHVDEVLGNQEVVVKNLGPQLNKVPGLAGISLLASGDVALIYNPVALAGWYGVAAHRQQAAPLPGAVPSLAEPEENLAPLVMVVDDSLTVRRVTQRLLEREGYRVRLAKDGLDAMEQLAADELPALVLSDIEMPRMDGFDLVRNMRSDARLAPLPVVMITSRIAQKHRDYAAQLGVDHYLGKPYDEEHLLELIGRYTSSQIAAPAAPR